jgi:hypothetical protein
MIAKDPVDNPAKPSLTAPPTVSSELTEYVLVIAAIAMAGYVASQGVEFGINGLIARVTIWLNAA